MPRVRLSSRGSAVVRMDTVRWVLVVAALAAADGGLEIPRAHGGDTKQRSKTEDPFLELDKSTPPAEEVPDLPDTQPQSTADAEPKIQPPRVTRDIKQIQLLKAEDDSETSLELEPPEKQRAPMKLPPVKNMPLGAQTDWKSKSAGPAGVQKPVRDDSPTPDDPESARFEESTDRGQLNESEPLAAVIVEGNKTIKSEEITRLIKTRPGRPPDLKQVKEDIQTLWARKWFFNVETRVAQSKKGQVLIFRVSERPVVQKVEYKGNVKIKEKALAELTGLKAGAGYDVGTNRELVNRIESHYHEKGYIHATVELEKGDSPEDREVVFKIVEGPKVVVTKISFTGNKFVNGPILATHLKTKKRILWLFGGKYDPTTIPEDKESLRQYYHGLGFFDVKITDRVGESDDKANIHIEYMIDEGLRYKIRNIEFVGNRVIPEEKLREGLKLKPNDFFNERFLTADQEKIVAQYGDLGRIFAKIDPQTSTPETPGIVDLIYKINEDRVYRIGRIRVHINGEHPHTKESVVLTRLPFKPGDLASQSKIKLGEQRLKNSQVFAGMQPGPGSKGQEPPRIEPVFPDGAAPMSPLGRQSIARGQNDVSDNRPTRKPVDRSLPPVESPAAPAPVGEPRSNYGEMFGNSLSAEEAPVVRSQNVDYDPPQNGPVFGDPMPEDPWSNEPPAYLDYNIYASEGQTGRLSFGVGVNSNAGLLGNAVLQENNFDLFRPPTSMQDIIDGTAWRGGGQQFRLEAYPGTQLSRYLVSWTDPYFLEQNVMLGVSGSYFQRYFPNWTEKRTGGTVRLGHQFTPYLSASVALRAEDVQISNPSVPTPQTVTSVLGDNFLSTAKFNVIHDTRDNFFLPGKGHYLEASYEQGIADFVFPKAELAAKQYFLVRERPDGGQRQVISLSANVGWTGNQTPFFERFFAGGFNTFRGFYFYGVTPRQNGFRVGGNFEFLGSAEYLYPVTVDNTIQLVGFTDFGTVDSTVTFNAFRLSVGGGIRLSVPMMGPVPLAIDFAVPLMKQSFDTTQVVSFSLGLLR